jgi:hypothetical protein
MDWTRYLTPGLGATGLLTIVVVMVLTGKLLPKAGVDDRLKDKDRQIETWRAAYERSMEIQSEQQRQVSALLEASRTATRVIAAIPQAAGLSTGGEGRGRELAAETDQ